jgi:hypothetical protein
MRSFEPNLIEFEKWINRLPIDVENFTSDLENLKKEFTITKSTKKIIDGNGINGEWLFDLNFSLIDNSIAYRDINFSDFTQKGYLVAFCPELENFLTVILWMPESSKNKDKLNIYHELNNRKNKDEYLCVSGNYRLGGKLGKLTQQTFAKITNLGAFRGKLAFCQSDKYSDWKTNPSINRSGENFAAHSSPAFMAPYKHLKKDFSNVMEDKCTYFSGLFKINSIDENNLDILFICNISDENNFFYKNHVSNILISNEQRNKLNEKYKNNIILGLFSEQIFRINNQFIRSFTLENFNVLDSAEDVLFQLLSQKLYYNYLLNVEKSKSTNFNMDTLLVCNIESFEKECKRIALLMAKDRMINMLPKISIDYFIQLYLDPFFIRFDKNIYYVPRLVSQIQKKDFKNFIQFLDSLENNNLDELVALSKGTNFDVILDNLKFLNLYNYYSKRTLIKMISGRMELWRL